MSQHPSGIHHLAFMAGDIKKHIAFFSEVMGCPLVALFDMHGVPGGLHAFLKMNEHSYFSIVQLPDVDKIPIRLGETHAGSGALPSAPGTLQHLAFRADTLEGLIAMRDRIRSHGINVIGPIDHGMCQSIYFAGPDHMTLEVATATGGIDPALWIDPAGLAKAGINDAEASRLKETYGGPEGRVFVECMRIRPTEGESKTAILFSHPIGGGSFLPLVTALAHAGRHVIYCNPPTASCCWPPISAARSP